MASTSWWNPSSFTASEGTFNTTSLPQNISAYFKRPAKVTKPSSRNQSPRTGGRRRMTTHLPARTRSVADAQRPNMNARQQLYRNAASSRPISWHPNLVNEFEQYQMSNHQFYPQSSNVPMNTTFAHGLVTPYTYPVVEPYFDCPNVPLEQMTGQDLSFVHSNHQAHNVYPAVQDGTTPDYNPISTDPYQATDFDVAHMAWPPLPPSMPQDLATAPTSPDFLPMPDFGQAFCVAQTEEVVDADELVGMGLYDSPAQVQSASLYFNGPLPVRRKSLKLEESFEPALQSDDGDDDAESEPTQQDISASADHYPTMSDAVDYRQGTEYMAQDYNSDPSYAQNPPQTMSAPFASGYPDQQGMMNGAMYNWF